MIRHTLLVSALSLALLAPANAQLFGPSDEEKAHEAGQDAAIKETQNNAAQLESQIRQLQDKVQGLTQSLSQATGTNEELQHQLQMQNDKVDKMQRDFAYRLCQLSAQQLGAGDQMNCAAQGTPSANMPPPSQGMAMQPGAALPPIGSNGNSSIDAGGRVTSEFDQAPQGPVRGRPPGTLGTLSGSGPQGMSQPQSMGGGNANQYQSAMALLQNAQYDQASAQFRAFADANPQDMDLAPQAIYWVGNIAFIQQDYSTAARTFAEVLKKYPKSTRAPEAMLKLGRSFMGMGQKSEGCTTLGLIKSKYPDAASQILSQAASFRKTACGK